MITWLVWQMLKGKEENMNNYEVTKCKCGKVIVTSEVGTVKVAGWQELEAVTDMLKSGMTVEQVASQYCSYCLFPIASHASKEEHEKHSDWLSYHEPQPQNNTFC